jgi:hypothetical protein
MQLRSVHGGREEGRRPGRHGEGGFSRGDLLVAIFFAGIGVKPVQMTKLAVGAWSASLLQFIWSNAARDPS